MRPLGGVFYGIWFLKCVFFSYLFCWLAYKFLPRAGATLLLPFLTLFEFLHVTPGFHLLPFFVTGILLGRHTAALVRWRAVIAVTSLVLFACLFPFWTWSDYSYGGAIGLSGGALTFNSEALLTYVFRYVIGLSGSMAVISLCAFLEKIPCPVGWLGGHTLEIYVMNNFVGLLMSPLHITIPHEGALIVLSLLVTLVQLVAFWGVVSLTGRWPLLRLILFGKRTRVGQK